jgi:hypothetical protein
MNCTCPPGTCKLFNHTGRNADICSGRALMPDGTPMSSYKIERYRSNWERLKSQGLLKTAMAFVSAEAKWIAAGMPKRSPEQIEEIYQLCQSCDKMEPSNTEGYSSCRLCGCTLAKFPNVINKIEMATENCPLAKW